MANTFLNYTSASVGTSPVTTYTVGGSTTAVVIGLNISNVTASQIAVDVQVAGVYLVKGVPIPANSAVSVLDGKIILKTTNTVVITSDAATSADVIVSVLEQT
jgi:hypothetical protein|tara:strand:+ start:1419 stop:1727 length:309 start_codon:yes stop_codon:yes gene_type:complete